jgi:hypothetical protein
MDDAIGVILALTLYGFLALLVATGAYYVVRRAVRDELREHDAERERGSEDPHRA